MTTTAVWPRRFRWLLVALLGVVVFSAAAGQNDEPIDADVRESVEVRLVIVDVLVVDKQDRTVPGLTLDDFELYVDYKPVPIDTLDESCPIDALEDPRPLRGLRDARRGVAPEFPRKLAIAVDYMHLRQTQRIDVLQRIKKMIRDNDAANEEIMVAALADGLRVEQRFTRDRAEVLRTLDRMENDITLWQPPFEHLHELRYFRNLGDLIDLLGLFSGNKAMLLFSNWTGASATYDVEFQEVSSKSTMSRVAIYPVIAAGLQFQTSPRLARLAVETGGRVTENTNDLSLGYARVQRDMTCRYAVGFYDRNVGRDKARRVSVRVKPKGLRTISSYHYEFPSEKQHRDSMLQAGYLSPETFADDRVHARFVPFRPLRGDRWQGAVAISFPVSRDAWNEEELPSHEFGATVFKGYNAVLEFDRGIELTTDAPASAERRVTFLEPVELRPGSYRISAVVLGKDPEGPRSVTTDVDLPEIPRNAPFLVGPIVGRRPAGQNAFDLIRSDRDPFMRDDPIVAQGLFEPIVGPQVEPGETLTILTRVCGVGAVEARRSEVRRRLLAADGGVLRELEARTVDLGGKRRARCVDLLDTLPTADRAPGTYAFEVELPAAGEVGAVLARAEFQVVAGDEVTNPPVVGSSSPTAGDSAD